jgi:O-antigen/teichoic acid export membrane protein
VLALTLGGVVAGAAYLLLTFSGLDSKGALFYLPSVPFVLLTTHLAAFMYGGGMLRQFNILRVLQGSVLLSALAAAAVVGRPDVSLVLMIAVVLSAMLALAAALALSRRVPLGQWTVNARIAKGLLDYGLRSYLGNLCWLFNTRLDQLMMSFLLSAAPLGIYATSVSYSGVVFSFFGAFAMLAFAKASAVDGHNEDEIRAIIRRHLVISLLTGVPAAIAVAVAAPWLYPLLFGAAFAPGVPAAVILCAASVFLGLNYTLSNGLRIRNQPLLPSIAEAVGVIVSIVGLTYVLPRVGIVGAALVSLLSYLTVFGLLLHFSRAQAGANHQAMRSAS